VTFRTAGACLLGLALLRPALAQSNKLPRTPEGKPDLQGIWQVRNRAAYDLEDHHAGFGMLAGEGVVEGNTIPYHNAKTWFDMAGNFHSDTVERFTPVDRNTIDYQATVTDPFVYTRPWTIAFLLKKQQQELLEVACLEDNQDLKHLKDVRDAAIKAKSSSREDKN